MIVPIFVPAGPLSYQRMRPVVAKNRSSFDPQSIHRCIMTAIGKNRRGVSANPPGLVRTPKNCAMISGRILIQNFGSLGTTHSAGRHKKGHHVKKSKPGSRKDHASWGRGVRGNVQEKTIGINSSGNAPGLARKRSQPALTGKIRLQSGNPYFPAGLTRLY